MSDSFYDRTTGNISGIEPYNSLSGIYPAFGSRASFSSRFNRYENQNGYYNSIPMSINNLNAKFELKYDLNESGAKRLVRFLESKNGQDFIEFNDPSNFYKTVSGVCINYGINHINKRHYEVGVSLEINQSASILNWSGMSFINAEIKNWSSGQQFKKYDILYSGVYSNKLNNFYYCIQDHISSGASIDGPTGNQSKWSQSFFFEPDIGIQNDVQLKVDKIEFKNSFIQYNKSSENIALLNMGYKFDNIPDQKAKAILHFLENKCGYRRFYHTPFSVYNRLKVYTCPSWSHTWNFVNSNTIQLDLVEDPLGVIPDKNE